MWYSLPLRPPGALDEPEFLRRCIQCGQCAQVCPYGSVTLAGTLNPLELGAPRVEPWKTPCYLCMRCPPVCPTGALRPIRAVEEAGMGLAVLNKDLCFTYEGSVFCKTCHEKCPLRNSTSRCVGCGVCEKVCPRKAIVTVPRSRLAGLGLAGNEP